MKKQKPTLSHYVILIKRALFNAPKRIIGNDYTIPSFLSKLRHFIGRLSPSILILTGSTLFLLYALWVSIQNRNNKQIFLHNSPYIDTYVAEQDNRSTQQEPIQQISITQADETITQQSSENIYSDVNPAVQTIYDLYTSINDREYIVSDYFDSYMSNSDFVQQYFTREKMYKVADATINGIQVVDATMLTSDRADRKHIQYSLSYTMRDNNQQFNELRTVTLRDQS